jgi:hypothetical protein
MQGVTILTWGSGDMMRLLSKLNKLKKNENTPPPPKKKIKTSMAKTMGPFLGSSGPEQMYRLNPFLVDLILRGASSCPRSPK